jgi:DnaJ-class molecular chaperone
LLFAAMLALLFLWVISIADPPAPRFPSHLRKMKPIKARFAVPLVDFIKGRTYDFIYTRRVRCVCEDLPNSFMCPNCSGHATVLQSARVSVSLGRGAADPRRFVIENITDSSEYFDSENLEITIEAQVHPLYERHNHDISGSVKLTPEELERGYRDIILPNGDEDRITFAPGQRSVRVPGMGIPYENSDRVGDLIFYFV